MGRTGTKSKDFINRVNSLETVEQRHELIMDKTPVCSDNPKEMFDFIYEADADPWSYDNEEAYRPLWDKIMENIKDLVKDKSVIDLGCGRGHVWRYMEKNENATWKDLLGLDISEKACKLASGIKNSTFTTKDFSDENLSLPKTDIVFSISALYYVPSTKRKLLYKKICDASPEYIVSIATRFSKDQIYNFPSVYSSKYSIVSEFNVRLKSPLSVGYHGKIWKRE